MTLNKLVGMLIYHKCLMWLSTGHGEHAIGTTEQVIALKDYLEANDLTLQSEDIVVKRYHEIEDSVEERVMNTALKKPESIEFFGCMDTGSFLLVVRYRGFLRKFRVICVTSKNESSPSGVLVMCKYLSGYGYSLLDCNDDLSLKPLNNKYRLLYNPNDINDHMFYNQLKDKWKAIGTITYSIHDLPRLLYIYPETDRHFTYTRSVTMYETKAGKIVAKSDRWPKEYLYILSPGFYNALVETMKDNSLDIIKTFLDDKHVKMLAKPFPISRVFEWANDSELPQAKRFMPASKYLTSQFMLEADIIGDNKEEVLKALAGYIFREISNDDRSN